MLFSPASKLHMATCLKERFEDRRIRIPAGNTTLRADLHAVRKIAGPTGQVRLMAEETADGHADRFWALALMASAAAGERRTYEFEAADTRPSHSDTGDYLHMGQAGDGHGAAPGGDVMQW